MPKTISKKSFSRKGQTWNCGEHKHDVKAEAERCYLGRLRPEIAQLASKPMRFEATCTCGTRVTGNGSKWRHDKQAADKHRAHPGGTLRQI